MILEDIIKLGIFYIFTCFTLSSAIVKYYLLYISKRDAISLQDVSEFYDGYSSPLWSLVKHANLAKISEGFGATNIAEMTTLITCFMFFALRLYSYKFLSVEKYTIGSFIYLSCLLLMIVSLSFMCIRIILAASKHFGSSQKR